MQLSEIYSSLKRAKARQKRRTKRNNERFSVLAHPGNL
jgi:hypothetical protein